MSMLEIKNLYVETPGGKKILNGINLKLETGNVYALMGPNGSGKSTLAHVIMGSPKYKITSGDILLDGKSIKNEKTHERAKKGLFMSFQYPQEISGVTIYNFLKTTYNSIKDEKERLSIFDFRDMLDKKAKALKIDESFLKRYLNDGFSGGEKKKTEMLQMSVLNPRIAILDETDSGLDIDALKTVANGINKFMNPKKCVLIITHYKRILDYVKPNKVSIMQNGKIVLEGDNEITNQLEEKGYDWIENGDKKI